MTSLAYVTAWMTVLALPATVVAQSPTIEIRVTGSHRTTAGDTPELARDLALLDARHKAWQTAIAHLQSSPDVKALNLKPGYVEAYTAVVLDAEEQQASAPPAAGSQQVEVRARLDAAGAARRMLGLHKDQDASWELVDAWTQTDRLYEQLAEQTRRRGGAGSEDAARLAMEQGETVTAIKVKQLTAQAYAAFARTVPATLGGHVSSPEGRDRAKSLAEVALELSPTSPDAHHLMGDLLIEAEQLREAEIEYRKGLEGSPNSAPARTKLAAALRLQGQFPEAITELREAQRIDPAYARSYSDLGMILRAQKNLPDAIAAYREAIRRDPDSTDAHNGLAVTLASRGSLDEAVTEFREIIRIDPDSTIGYYNLAYALADLDRDIESAAALREVIRINPDHYNARYNLGELFRLEQKFDDSASQFREYLRLAPDTPQNQRNIRRAKDFIRQFEDPNAPAPVAPVMRPK